MTDSIPFHISQARICGSYLASAFFDEDNRSKGTFNRLLAGWLTILNVPEMPMIHRKEAEREVERYAFEILEERGITVENDEPA